MEHHAVLIRVSDTTTYEVPPASTGTSQFIENIPQFGIGDARRLIVAANRRPAEQDSYMQLVVVTNFITVEAQQALLKVIEEPPSTTSFIFVIPSSLQLLPTLLSRFAIDTDRGEFTPPVCSIDAFEAFHQAAVQERMEQIELATKQKDHEWQNDIKCGLITYLASQTGKYSSLQLKSLHYVATMLLTRGASNKMLLEELALTL